MIHTYHFYIRKNIIFFTFSFILFNKETHFVLTDNKTNINLKKYFI